MLHPFVAAAAFVLVEASVIAVSLAAGSALGGRCGLNMITRSMRTAELAEAQQETTQKPEEEQRQQQDHAQEPRQVAQVQEEKFPTGRVETEAAADKQTSLAEGGVDGGVETPPIFCLDPTKSAMAWKTCTTSLEPFAFGDRERVTTKIPLVKRHRTQTTTHNNFVRGAYWSPDGACLLAYADDNCYRLFDMYGCCS